MKTSMRARGHIRSAATPAVLALLLAAAAVHAPVHAAVPAEGAATSSGAVAETVRVRVWPHQGYGRIVFDWPAAVPHSARLDHRALAVRFGKPFTADLGDITARLGAYVAAARAGEDGRSVVLTLKPEVRFKTFDTGASVVVDLLPPASHPSNADAGGSALAVPVRAGTHATFGRLVFDWPGNVDYTVEEGAGQTRLRFSRKGAFDLAAVTRDRPPFLRGIAAAGDLVTLSLAEGARLRHFRSGMSVVVDVLRPAAEKTPAPAAKAPPVKPPAESAAPKVAPAPVGGPVAVLDMKTAKVTPAAEAAPTPLTAEPSTSQPSASRPRLALVEAGAVPVILTLDPAAAVIKFHWSEEVGAAVFERAGYLWAVFDRESRLAFEGWEEAMAKPSPNSRRRPEEKPAAAFIDRPLYSSMPGTTVFRMRIPPGVNPRVARDKAAWVVTLERDYLKPAAGIAVEAHLAGPDTGARLFISFADAGQAVAVNDPEVGDRIWVAPVAAPEKGVGLARAYAEVELFATAQGIAGRAVRDDVVFRTLPKGIEISAPAGLTLSGMNAVAGRAAAPEAQPPAGETRPGWLFDFESWRRAATGGFMQNKHALQRAAAMAAPTARNGARLELAQLYFAYDYLTDTLGLLQVIEQDAPDLAQEPGFRALRGAAYYRLGDYERAARDLEHPSLDVFKEAALWRAGLAAAAGDWVTASRFFSRAEKVTDSYPPALRIHFGLKAAETSLNIGDVGLAKFHLDALEALTQGNPSERAAVDYLRGRLLAKVLDPDGAAAAWERAIKGPDRRVRVLATLARTDLLLESGKITRKDAIAALEKLRYAWRGDDLEFKVLHHIGRTYMNAGDYKNGLLTLRELATYFPKNPETEGVIDSMRAAFIKLYVDGEADKVAPLTALALYDQFRELTPQGEVGDRLIASLAERLVAVDLLDRAASLLKHLVDERLKGIGRFDAANRLALVYLLDRKPQQALDALAGDVPAGIIPDSATARRHLKARALAELARYQEALALVAKDSSTDAEMLRAEVYWRLRDWPNAAIAYAKIVKDTVKDGARGADGEPVQAVLGESAQRNVLSLAIAHALGRDQEALKGLRMRFLGRMAKTGFREAFDVVTTPTGNVPDDYRAISSKIAEVDQFRAFITSYREKLLGAGKASQPATPAPASDPQARQSASAPARG